MLSRWLLFLVLGMASVSCIRVKALLHLPINFKSADFVTEHHFDFPKNLIPLAADLFELDGQKYLFVSFFVNPKDFKKNPAHPIYIFSINSNGTLNKDPLVFGNAEHVRHFSRLTTPWGEGIILADHGVDDPVLNKGGKILLIVKNKNTNKLEDMSSRLNLSRNFSFNIVAPKRKNHKYSDIFIIPFNTKFSSVVYLQATNDGYIDASNLLPVEWRNKDVCYMTGVTIDLNHAGTDDIFLGGCDQDIKMNPSTKDTILSWNGKKWVWNLKVKIPFRLKEKGWGTVFLTTADLDNTGYEDVIALTHDWGFHQGLPQVLMRDKKNHNKIIFNNSEVLNWPISLLKSHNYLHKIITYDIDNDGHLDLIGQIVYIDQNYVVSPNIFVLINKRGHWEYKNENIFNIPKNKHVLSIGKMKFNRNKKDSVVFIFYNGDIKIF